MKVRTIEIDNFTFKDVDKFAVKIIEGLGTDFDGLLVTKLTSNGPEVALYDTYQDALDVANGFNEGSVEIIKYVYKK